MPNRLFNVAFFLDADAKVRSVQQSGDGVEIQYLHQDGLWHIEHFDSVLAATCRALAVKDWVLK